MGNRAQGGAAQRLLPLDIVSVHRLTVIRAISCTPAGLVAREAGRCGTAGHRRLFGEPGAPLFKKFREEKGGTADDQGGSHYNRNPADDGVCPPPWGGRCQLMPAITAEDCHLLDFFPAVGTRTSFHNQNLYRSQSRLVKRPVRKANGFQPEPPLESRGRRNLHFQVKTSCGRERRQAHPLGMVTRNSAAPPAGGRELPIPFSPAVRCLHLRATPDRTRIRDRRDFPASNNDSSS
jgi:hypothetical protein